LETSGNPSLKKGGKKSWADFIQQNPDRLVRKK
jgi:hypothetical protein